VDLEDSRIVRTIFKGRDLLLESAPLANTKALGALSPHRPERLWATLADIEEVRSQDAVSGSYGFLLIL